MTWSVPGYNVQQICWKDEIHLLGPRKRRFCVWGEADWMFAEFIACLKKETLQIKASSQQERQKQCECLNRHRDYCSPAEGGRAVRNETCVLAVLPPDESNSSKFGQTRQNIIAASDWSAVATSPASPAEKRSASCVSPKLARVTYWKFKCKQLKIGAKDSASGAARRWAGR